jgi:hypothetical protein
VQRLQNLGALAIVSGVFLLLKFFRVAFLRPNLNEEQAGDHKNSTDHRESTHCHSLL